MPDFSAHDSHVAENLAQAVEASLPALEATADAPPAVRDQAAPRRKAITELRAAAPAGEASAGESVIERAAHALERLTGGAGGGGTEPPTAGLDALARAEDALQARFEAALADERLSGPVRDAVLRAYDRVKPGHDVVRQALLSARGEA